VSRTALFDLDGTLVDTRPGILDSLRFALGALGHAPAPDEDLNWTIGPPLEQSIGRLLARWGDPREAEAVTLYRRYYAECGMWNAAVYPGIPAALAAFRTAGWMLMVATAKRTRFARPLLEHLGLACHFRAIYGSEDGPRLDTKPELLAHILAEQHFDPASAVMIGDRHYDTNGAHAHGIRAIGVTWGYGTRAELQAAAPDGFADRPVDLLALAQAVLAPEGRGLRPLDPCQGSALVS
jgi:phosphoglycolate phosphatase